MWQNEIEANPNLIGKAKAKLHFEIERELQILSKFLESSFSDILNFV